jgi:hypothetical protein
VGIILYPKDVHQGGKPTSARYAYKLKGWFNPGFQNGSEENTCKGRGPSVDLPALGAGLGQVPREKFQYDTNEKGIAFRRG